jgi:FG-GAP-like repeat
MATLMFGASHSLPNPTINDLVTNSDSILAGLGRIVHLEVNLTGLTHAFSDDLDFLFVGPNGANFEFWSDAGGSKAISNGNFTISDSGAFLLPDGTPIASGTYRPSDYLTVENSSNWGLAPGVIINHPTPNGTATLDSVFDGLFVGTTNWSLYVKDDTMGDVGTLVNWGFHITYNLIVKPDDFNGNFLSDILWQSSDGTPAIWLMNGTSSTFFTGAVGPFNPGPSWQIKDDGDFDGDGRSDILWQNSDGTPAIWLMNGTSVASLGGIGPFPFNPGPSWQIKGTGDFNFDTKADILWQGSDGTPAIWLMNGMNALAVGAVGPFNPGPSWQIKGTGDFNNDGRADILWQGSDGTPAIWLMDGMNALAVGAVGPFNPGPTWQIKGTGDFNADGRSDILWQSSDGTPAIWLMNGMNAFAFGAVGPFNPGPSWHVQGTGDYNLDARSDILWQSDDGTPAIWTMNGMNVISVGAAGSFNPGSDWHVIA